MLRTIEVPAAMQHYADRLKAGIEIARPTAIGVLKIKAKIGELLPAKSPANRGQGRNGKKSTALGAVDLGPHTISAYRKLAANAKRIDEYAESVDDVPTQGEFIRFCAAQWWIGDWLLYGEGRPDWGDKYEQAISLFNRPYDTLADYKAVAQRFQFPDRSGN